jgi:hypothetical protein
MKYLKLSTYIDYLFYILSIYYAHILKFRHNISIGSGVRIDIQSKFVLRNVNRGGKIKKWS